MKISDPLSVSSSVPVFEQDRALAKGSTGLPKSRSIRISLKQWRMFHAVVDFDGFAEAADHLHVSQSSVSHALAKLQEQLGVALLTLQGRKARITEEGKLMLECSRELVKRAIELEELADNLREGWGPEVRLAVDPDFPSDLLMHTLHQLASSARKFRLSVQETTADRVSQVLHANAVDLAISAQTVSGFSSRELIGIEHVAVAHPNNPLFSLKRSITLDDLKHQTKVVVTGSNDYFLAPPRNLLPLTGRQWNVGSLERAVSALSQGNAYAWLPKYRLQQCFEHDLLRILPIDSGSSHTVRLHLILGRSVAERPYALEFAEVLRSVGRSQH